MNYENTHTIIPHTKKHIHITLNNPRFLIVHRTSSLPNRISLPSLHDPRDDDVDKEDDDQMVYAVFKCTIHITIRPAQKSLLLNAAFLWPDVCHLTIIPQHLSSGLHKPTSTCRN